MSNNSCDQYPLAVMLRVKEPNKTAKFYCDVLGFTMKESWPDKENPMWANLVLDKQSIMIGAQCDPEQAKEFGCSDKEIEHMKRLDADYKKSVPGAGVGIYLMVSDVDAFHKNVAKNGGKPVGEPKTQFYGLRDFQIFDPDGYMLDFYSPIKLDNCQSCAMPLQDAQPGQMYCQYCTTEEGTLRPYEQVFEGTVKGYFMQMQKMQRPAAETAAREHLSKQPAWAGRK
jgi:uncharacterized glyoxalase superfamily protein PhnB